MVVVDDSADVRLRGDRVYMHGPLPARCGLLHEPALVHAKEIVRRRRLAGGEVAEIEGPGGEGPRQGPKVLTHDVGELVLPGALKTDT